MRLALLFSGQGHQRPEHWLRLRAGLQGGAVSDRDFWGTPGLEIAGGPALLARILDGSLPDGPGALAAGQQQGGGAAGVAGAAGAAEAAEEPLRQDPPEAALLMRNRVAQPFIFAYEWLLWQHLAPHLPKPVCVAGYSLGEMTACAVAGVYGAGDGLCIGEGRAKGETLDEEVLREGLAWCILRARAMDACVEEPAGMLAVLGLPEAVLRSIARESHLHIAICNGSAHFILGGLARHLPAAEAAALAAGASRVQMLEIGTPSHTPLLVSASQVLERVWGGLPSRRLPFPVLSAVNGVAAYTSTVAAQALAAQVSNRLDWGACMDMVAEMKPDRVLEIGPGNALAKLWAEREMRQEGGRASGRATGIPVRSSDDFRSVAGILAWLRG